MRQEHKLAHERIYFLDNIRSLMILLVVVLHSAEPYTHYRSWWAVNDQDSVIIDKLFLTLDVFLMPILFFIAGYFTLPSLKNKSAWLFIKKKFRRLGLPFIIGILVINPIYLYIWNYSRGYLHYNIWDVFLGSISSATKFQSGFINNIDQFQCYHLWFISLLLLFFIVFIFLHSVNSKLSTKSTANFKSRTPSNL